MKRYPVIFKPHYIEKVWGGSNLNSLGKEIKGDHIGESWEISSRDEWESKILNGEYKGKSISFLREEFGSRWFGKDFERFPLLIKFLDINDKLSVQVHPDDNYALEHENDLGKFEVWYIVDASDDATLIAGVDPKCRSKKALRKVLEKGDDSLLNKLSVKKGDFLVVPPGLLHATYKGSILIAEVQQNSDTTYRLYDFDRVDSSGNRRDLHLDRGLEVVELDLAPQIISTADIDLENGVLELLSSDFFNLKRVTLEGSIDLSDQLFSVIMVLDGEITIGEKGDSYSFKKGDSILLPADYKAHISSDRSEFLYITL